MSQFHGWPSTQPGSCTQPCNVNTHSRAHCSPETRLCEQWEHGCVNNGGTAVSTMGHGCVQVPGCVEGHPWVHCDRDVIILTKFSSLAALEVVKMKMPSKWQHFRFSITWWPLLRSLAYIYMECLRNFHHWLHRTWTSSKSRMSHIITLITRPCTNIDDMFNSGVKSFQRVIVISISRVERLYGKTKVICTRDIYIHIYIYIYI